MKAPTPKQIDALKRQIDKHDLAAKPTAKQLAAGKLAAAARAKALDWALHFGITPASAPASKRIHGIEWQFTAVGGTFLAENPGAVAELRSAMLEADQEALFVQLYTPITRWERAKEAANNLANAPLPKKLRKLFDEIFARTATSADRKPSLRIDPVK